jgi:hypothetical protein
MGCSLLTGIDMFDTATIVGIVLLLLIVVISVNIFLNFQDEIPVRAQKTSEEIEKEEEDFQEMVTAPIINDGLDFMGSAMESIKLGCEYFKDSRYVDASSELERAADDLKAAEKKFIEVAGMMEDPENQHARSGRTLLIKCRDFLSMVNNAISSSDDLEEEKPADKDLWLKEVEDLEEMARAWRSP